MGYTWVVGEKRNEMKLKNLRSYMIDFISVLVSSQERESCQN